MKIIEIQRRLIALGFDTGGADGILGRKTQAAIREFQEEQDLLTDGIVGPNTLKALLAEAGDPWVEPSALPLPWLDEARRLMGTKEGAGGRDNKEILDWADDLDIHYPHDSIAWCGLFVAHCIGSQLPEEDLPDNPLGARNWRNFGRKSEAQTGAILVFWRTHPTQSFNGHVGFYVGEDNTSYHVLGGNQADSVSIARVGKNRFLTARWPSTAKFLATGRVEGEREGDLSSDEA